MTTQFSCVASAKLMFICWKNSGMYHHSGVYQCFCGISLIVRFVFSLFFFFLIPCLSLVWKDNNSNKQTKEGELEYDVSN